MEVRDVYCICGQQYDKQRFMIQCDACRDWFHGSCVGVREYVSIDLDKYHCPQCELTFGPPVFKKQLNWHRHNYSDPEADTKPVQTGTPVFIKELKTRHFRASSEVLLTMEGHELTMTYMYQHGFDQPIMIESKEGLEIQIPPDTFTVHDVEALIGSDRQVDVIDVCRQSDIRMRIGDFVNYFTNPNRLRVLNLISLEFSKSSLAERVEAPLIAREMDWVNTVWPAKNIDNGEETKKPEVQKYCLIGVQDSYTDFHIDFGGTSVWYHVLKGEKVFYLIRPTTANLSLYQRWMLSSTQDETFFADQVDECYKCIVHAGNTMLIPTGWIHAVLTPSDSIVFGGNFLHSLNIPMQLQIYDMEKKIRTPEKFRFPGFETINWYAAQCLCEELKKINEQGTKVPNYLLLGVKALLCTLKQWSQDKDTAKSRLEEIPATVEGPKLLKDLSKEIRQAERYLNSLNPPKPERESKRKKRKPVNKDFVDYSLPQNILIDEQIKSEPKEPLKLSIKVLNNKKFKVNQEENVVPPVPPPTRPPLKLTLPKPATYPYSTSLDTNNHSFGHSLLSKEGNKSATNNTNNVSPFVKMKKEGELKVKIPKLPETLPRRPFDTGFTTKITNSNSVYDFHDDSEDIDDEDDNCLTIDENPKKRAAWNNSSSKSTVEPLSVKFISPNNRKPKHQLHLSSVLPNFRPSGTGLGSEMDIGGEVDVVSDLPKNGIEELLKASCYAREPSPKVHDSLDLNSIHGKRDGHSLTSPIRNRLSGRPDLTWSHLALSNSKPKDQNENRSGRASPSTREAIAGMLSIGQANHSRSSILSGSSALHQPGSSKARRKKMLSSVRFAQDEIEENIHKVHQDEDFIYPSLDLSDDEDGMVSTPRTVKRVKADEAWSPKAKVGQVLPKTDRPAREGAKKRSVEKGLEAAAARRAQQGLSQTLLPMVKRPYRRKKPKRPAVPVEPLPSTSTAPVQPAPAVIAPFILKSDSRNKKPKKGMATAKQRLGKILKIHKMIH